MKYLYCVAVSIGCQQCAGGEIERRVIRVPLTDEQEKLIEPRFDYLSGGKEYKEQVVPTSIQKD